MCWPRRHGADRGDKQAIEARVRLGVVSPPTKSEMPTRPSLLGGLDLLQAAEGARHPLPRWRDTVRWRRVACLRLGRARDAVDQEHRDELARFGCARAGFV